MFNLVMGIIMVGIGCVCLVWGVFSKVMAVPIFFGTAMLIFGITEIIRSKAIRQRKKDKKSSEFDAYMRIAEEMGVVVNPITHEIVSKKNESQKTDIGQTENHPSEEAQTTTEDKTE